MSETGEQQRGTEPTAQAALVGHATETPIRRNLVVQRWGTPTAIVGSVNEPREMEERGHRFNEKWIYRSAGTLDAPAERVIYWLRYDFVASYLVGQGGDATRENPR